MDRKQGSDVRRQDLDEVDNYTANCCRHGFDRWKAGQQDAAGAVLIDEKAGQQGPAGEVLTDEDAGQQGAAGTVLIDENAGPRRMRSGIRGIRYVH